MATTTATPSRTTTTSVFPLVAFFVLSYALTWLILVTAGFGLLPDSAGILAWQARRGAAAPADGPVEGGRSPCSARCRSMTSSGTGRSSSRATCPKYWSRSW